MYVSDFDYDLPLSSIAQFPLPNRGTTRLLVLNRRTGAIENRHYPDLIEYLEPGDVVVLNDTKVIKARLIAKNQIGQLRELLLLETHGSDRDNHHRKILYRGKLHKGEELTVASTPVTVETVKSGGLAIVNSPSDLLELAEQYGNVPLPPYMKRAATSQDSIRYQTTFAKTTGSVAAPTASLNFTRELWTKLEAKGIRVVLLTLHVGLGTFLPIRSDMVEGHKMHSEYFELPIATIEAIKTAKYGHHKVVAIGTTVARTLEYTSKNLLQTATTLSGEADIFIYPGYNFQVVDALVTNFHAPRSTVLMMAAAFAGWDNLKPAYKKALYEGYQFLSYGDSMLIY